MNSPTRNQRRALRIGHVLTWCKDWSIEQEGLVDLLTDAMHWCRINGHDFDRLLETATKHYQTETIEETGVLP